MSTNITNFIGLVLYNLSSPLIRLLTISYYTDLANRCKQSLIQYISNAYNGQARRECTLLFLLLICQFESGQFESGQFNVFPIRIALQSFIKPSVKYFFKLQNGKSPKLTKKVLRFSTLNLEVRGPEEKLRQPY